MPSIGSTREISIQSLFGFVLLLLKAIVALEPPSPRAVVPEGVLDRQRCLIANQTRVTKSIESLQERCELVLL